MSRHSADLQPPPPDWRLTLKPGDLVDVRYADEGWHWGLVTAVHHGGDRVKIRKRLSADAARWVGLKR